MTVENYLKRLRNVNEEQMLEKLIARIEDSIEPESQAAFQKAADKRRAELCDYQFSLNDDFGEAKAARRY
ncbi:MAG TPA: hypothetical protein VH187_04265 [Scandinavium sp.]|jgi:hypothetical protein|uniref:hypothetical protein n=1 Tax=Scandinavium sp. TaxID=2830653 RepID=UPI002E356AB5|nr:hypothetical protein [Scandinavium sp.]HEX4500375.1 hypothetical protein [Scandinavium sp.]